MCVQVVANAIVMYVKVVANAIVMYVQVVANAVLMSYVFLIWHNSPPLGHGLLIHDVSRSHNDAPQSVGLSGRGISSSQRPLPDNMQHSQQTDINPAGGIRTHSLSRRAAADLRLRPRGTGNVICTGS